MRAGRRPLVWPARGSRLLLLGTLTLVVGTDYSRQLVTSRGFDAAVRRFRRVEFRRQECQAGRAVKRAAVVLLDGTGSEASGEVRAGGLMRRDVKSQRRETGVS